MYGVFIKAILSGFMIAFGCIIYLMCPNKMVGALLFSFGLLTIICRELYLYTGKIGYIKEVGIVKILLTNICISTGLRGGHFFPVIFAGVCMGYGLSMLIFPGGGHEVFAAAVITATLLGGIMKKPLAVTVLLFICFPIRLFFWIFIGAAVGKAIMDLPVKKKETQHQ